MSAGRPDRSTEAEVGRPTCTDVHAAMGWWAGRSGCRLFRELCYLKMAPVDRPVDRQEFCSLYPALVDRAVDRPESHCSLAPGPVDRWHNGHKNDRWSVDRPVDQKGKNALSYCQRADLFWGYIYPILWLFSPRILRPKFSIFQLVFKSVFVLKDLIFICF